MTQTSIFHNDSAVVRTPDNQVLLRAGQQTMICTLDQVQSLFQSILALNVVAGRPTEATIEAATAPEIKAEVKTPEVEASEVPKAPEAEETTTKRRGRKPKQQEDTAETMTAPPSKIPTGKGGRLREGLTAALAQGPQSVDSLVKYAKRNNLTEAADPGHAVRVCLGMMKDQLVREGGKYKLAAAA